MPFNIFGGLIDIAKADADSIELAIEDILDTHGVPHEKLVAFCSDGASVMTGIRNGLAQLLKERMNPSMISLHCICHRLALCCKDASHCVDYMETIMEPTLNNLYFFYEFSPQRKGSLLELQSILGSPAVKLCKSGHTRWLSIERVVHATRVAYIAILDDLAYHASQTSKYSSTAKGLHKTMHTIKFASTLFLLSDVLQHVALLSKRFQKETVSWYQIAGAVESTQDVLHAFKVSDGLYTESLIKELKLVSGLHEPAVADAEQEEEEEETKVIESKEQTESPVADVDSAAAEDEDDDMDEEALPTPRLDVEESDDEGSRGNKHVNTVDSCGGASGVRKRLRKWTSKDLKSCRKLRVQFLQALIDELEKRFPKEELATMRQFSVVFDPSLWPKPRAAVGAIDMGRYGLDELKKLHERFASRLDSWEMLRLEYSQLLPMLPRVFQTTIKAREPTVQDVMCELVKEDKSVSFPNCSHLLAIALVLPVATAERGFSTMKRIKTALRNRMEGTKLLSLMVISIQGVETQDMKFRPAVETWFGLRKRRITPGVTFLHHWRSMEPSQSAIVLRNKDAAAKAKKSAVKKPTSRTANQLNFPPNPAAVKDASSAAPVVVGDGSGGVPMLLGEAAFVGAAAATSAGPGVAAAASLLGAAADVALSDLELPAKATEKAVLQAGGGIGIAEREGRRRQSERKRKRRE